MPNSDSNVLKFVRRERKRKTDRQTDRQENYQTKKNKWAINNNNNNNNKSVKCPIVVIYSNSCVHAVEREREREQDR